MIKKISKKEEKKSTTFQYYDIMHSNHISGLVSWKMNQTMLLMNYGFRRWPCTTYDGRQLYMCNSLNTINQLL